MMCIPWMSMYSVVAISVVVLAGATTVCTSLMTCACPETRARVAKTGTPWTRVIVVDDDKSRRTRSRREQKSGQRMRDLRDARRMGRCDIGVKRVLVIFVVNTAVKVLPARHLKDLALGARIKWGGPLKGVRWCM